MAALSSSRLVVALVAHDLRAELALLLCSPACHLAATHFRARPLARQAHIEHLQKRLEAHESEHALLAHEKSELDARRRQQLLELATYYEAIGDVAAGRTFGKPTSKASAADGSEASENGAGDGAGDGAGGDGEGPAGDGEVAESKAKGRAAGHGRRRGGGGELKRMASLEAYSRLFLDEDTVTTVEYTDFSREAVRTQLARSLGRHILADGGKEKRRYFDLVLNRARSALTHNVFDRFDDALLEQLALAFARLDLVTATGARTFVSQNTRRRTNPTHHCRGTTVDA